MNKKIISSLITILFINFISASYAVSNVKPAAATLPTQKKVITKKNETNDEICDRLAMRIQNLKQEVRDNKKKNDIKDLISFSTGLNFTTQIYLKMNCDPMQILQPIYTPRKK